MSYEGKLLRGEKWSGITKRAEALGDQSKLDWLKSQQAIQDDIKVYEDSLKPEKKPKEEKPKEKGKGGK